MDGGGGATSVTQQSGFDGRDMNGPKINMMDTSDSVRNCASVCAGYDTEYRYMGLQWANECSCGNVYASKGNASDSDCGITVDDGGKKRALCLKRPAIAHESFNSARFLVDS